MFASPNVQTQEPAEQDGMAIVSAFDHRITAVAGRQRR
jgi:hypothetical protein